MIRLRRTAAPLELTASEVQRLTAEFISDKSKRVWNKKYIKNSLKVLSSGKCCYCEAIVDEESQYMEVEHFECKAHHPHKVMDWTNLLPSCKRCNLEKGEYDIIASGDIIDPTIHNPNDHIYMRDDYRFMHRDDRGKRTIKEIYLNDTDRLGVKRYKVGEFISDAIDRIVSEMVVLRNNPLEVALQRKIARSVRNLLREASPSKAYSATAATCILRSRDYVSIKAELFSMSIWDQSLQEVHDVAINAALLE